MITVFASLLLAATPLGVRVEVQPLGKGSTGTVVGVAVQVAPEDRARAGSRVALAVALLKGSRVVDEATSVVELAADGSALVYREWPAGEAEARVRIASLDATAEGSWRGTIVVPIEATPFAPPDDAPPDAVALSAPVPGDGVVRFLPPPRSGGLGAVQLEVTAPEGTDRVEFFQDDQALVARRRAPWTVSVPLGEVARRTTVRAVAFARDGRFLGEDAVVLNAPAGQLPVEILLAPETATADGVRVVTVAVGSTVELTEVTLAVDGKAAARWPGCPCTVRIPAATLAAARVLAAEARGARGERGEAVRVLAGAGFVDRMEVEVVELPVVVLDAQQRLIADLDRSAFRVFEDGVEVAIDGFATNADLPLRLGIVVDTSGSMVKSFAQVREAVAGFAGKLLRAGDTFFVATFSWEPALAMAWGSDVAAVTGVLERVTPEGGTSLNDAVVRSLEQFRGQRGRTAVVLLTDGDDTTSRTGWDATMRFVETARVPLFTVGFNISKLDFFIRERLEKLATVTGGEVFFAPKVGELPGVYTRISERLRSQYLISYRSPSKKGSDEFRAVKVEVARPGLSARTIAGYYPAR